MSGQLRWDREGRIWPHRTASTFVSIGSPAPGPTWHVQRMGTAGKPRLLLLHGTGASVHSWRGLMPILARDYDVIAPDLPRHAFTTGHSLNVMSLPRMAHAVDGMLTELDFAPDIIAGHSAGAAIALQLALDHGYTGPIVGLNSALRPFSGPAAQMFPTLAKLLFVNPFVPRVFSAAAGLAGGIDGFLKRATGSNIDAQGVACYSALLKNSRHTEGALAMMANWDLPALRERMRDIANPVLLIHSDNDAAIPLDWAREADSWLPNSRLEIVRGHGHLLHEESPASVADIMRPFVKEAI